MRVSTMVRSSTLLFAVVALGACSDAATAPQAARAFRPDASTVPTLGRTAQNVHVRMVAWNRIAFTIDPNRDQNVRFGDHTLYFPAQSVCDPATSPYGEEYWNAPCPPLRSRITITAEWTYRDAHVEVEFLPALRFVPAGPAEVERWVVLGLSERNALQSQANYRILWRNPEGVWVDESLDDPSMSTFVDSSGERVARRIKHFSGYNVTAGFASTDGWSTDTDIGASGLAP